MKPVDGCGFTLGTARSSSTFMQAVVLSVRIRKKMGNISGGTARLFIEPEGQAQPAGCTNDNT